MEYPTDLLVCFTPARVREMTEKPGVYCMLDAGGKVLYVGKAKNLKKRVASYFGAPSRLSAKTRALVQQIANIQLTATHTENEALLLENNLIKKYLPPFNILLRDDKSYPYIFLSNDPFPRITLRRGAKKEPGRYFGPYPSASAVRDNLNLLQKLFLLRPCENSVFNNRARPCLQYQIKRCTAPCVGLIDETAYQEDTRHAIFFLEGKSAQIIDRMVERMNAAAATLAYEQAARLRDQITRLRQLQERQYMDVDGAHDVDVVACVVEDGAGCVQVMTIRGGRHLGSRAYFPKHTQGADEAAVLAAFLPQYYLHRDDIPAEIILSQACEDREVLQEVIQTQRGKAVHIHHAVRGARAHWLTMAKENAALGIASRKPGQYRDRLADLARWLEWETLPARIECFDISHTQGESAQASCVVFDSDGPCPAEYRRFNLRNITPGDDYAAMEQALQRRYRTENNNGAEPRPLPDLLLIDGGPGQVARARAALADHPNLPMIGIAKGDTRKPGLESLLLSPANNTVYLPADSPALLLLQQIRDEAHRFAITGHRKKRAAARKISMLEELPGIGPRRRQLLISHFGGLQGVQRAGVEDLCSVPGINRQLAKKIHEAFHGGGYKEYTGLRAKPLLPP